ncbi:hypothetical protein DTO021C3_7842 [Paecilomyces variotii]|nr:hypothetical protein DTO021C3_7842 [Paecilomyces variotii]
MLAPKPFPTTLGSGLGLMVPLARLSLSHVPIQYLNCSNLSASTIDGCTNIVSTPFTTSASGGSTGADPIFAVFVFFPS